MHIKQFTHAKTKALFLAAVMTAIGAGSYHLRAQEESPVRAIPIVAKRFGFSPDHLSLKKGETVKLQLTSNDVTHGFFLRPLKVDAQIEPGKTTEVTVTPQKAGRFTLICDHFCGANHGNMHMVVEVLE